MTFLRPTRSRSSATSSSTSVEASTNPGLSRAERLHLQKLLLAAGYDIGEADGKIGPITRAAIAEAEKKAGLPPTGRAGQKIYRALGGN